MIKLSRMVINGFKNSKQNVEINFSPNNYSIIYGNNGSGKTTLLMILLAVLSQDSKRLEKEHVNKIIITYFDGISNCNTVTIEKAAKEEIFIMVDDKGKQESLKVEQSKEYDWGEFENSPLTELKSMFFGVQRGIQTQHYFIDENDIIMFFKRPHNRDLIRKDEVPMNIESIYNLSHQLTNFLNSKGKRLRSQSIRSRAVDLDKSHVILENINIDQIESQIIERFRSAKFVTSRKIQNALFDTFSLAIDNKLSDEGNIPDDYYQILNNNSDRLVEALEDSSSNPFTKRLISLIKSNNEMDISGVDTLLLKNLIYRMIKEIEQEKEYLYSINTLLNVFNEHLCDDKKLIIESNKILVKVGDETHSVNALSSGERHLLTFLAFVLIDGSQRDFLIIDEPEISLNSKWQRTLMPLLSQLAPETQIIVASHSPAIAKNDPNALVEIIRYSDSEMGGR